MRYVEKILSHLFFIFFTAQILSPQISGMTIYLEWVVAIINPFFWKWIRQFHPTMRCMYILLCLCGVAVFGHISSAVKLSLNLFGILYLRYLFTNKLWKLDLYIFISIVFAVLQFVFMIIDPEFAASIGPSAIAAMVWGDMATPTFTNFYDALGTGFIRVSGLSREAGFFASLLVGTILLNYLRNKTNARISKWHFLPLMVGYAVSFSKMSITLVGVFVFQGLRKIINKIPFGYIIICFLFCLIIFWSFNEDYLRLNGTFLDRFGAYPVFTNLDIKQFLFGTDITNINSYLADLEYATTGSSDQQWFAGMGGWIIYNGIISFVFFVFCMYFLGITSTGVLVFILLTINVQPDTNQNFVVLAYFIVFSFYNRFKIIDDSRINFDSKGLK